MAFAPEQHGFKSISFQTEAKSVHYYELESDQLPDGDYDPLRLNVYLSLDGAFANIWFGLLEPLLAEIKLGFQDDPDINFHEIYDELFFRGYIENNNDAAIILKALRINRHIPQALRRNENGQLECYSLL